MGRFLRNFEGFSHLHFLIKKLSVNSVAKKYKFLISIPERQNYDIILIFVCVLLYDVIICTIYRDILGPTAPYCPGSRPAYHLRHNTTPPCKENLCIL